MSEPSTEPVEPDANEHEIDPPTPEEIELGRRAVEYVRHTQKQQEAI